MASGMRIGGLASGFDTEGTISKLMESEKVRYNKFYQTRQTNLWKKEAYNSFNKDLASFVNSSSKSLEITRNSYGSIFESSRNAMTWLKKGTTSDSAIANVSVGSGATTGSYTLEVDELARGVKGVSTADLRIADPNPDMDKQYWNASGNVVKDGKIKIEVKDSAGQIQTVNIQYSNGDKLSDVFTKIRNAKYTDSVTGDQVSVNLNIYSDSGSGKLFVSTKATGANSYLKMTDLDSSGNPLVGEGLIYNMGIEGNGQKITDGMQGQDAEVKIDGVSLTYSSNQFSFNNMNISISKKTSGTPIELTVAINVDEAYNKIKEFVDSYNKLVDSVNKKTSEKIYRDYKPLLEDQRKTMNEDDIKLWDEKSKSGLLKQDSLLSGVVSGVRKWIYEEVEGASGSYNSIYQVGIETTSNYKEPGKLQINETKLKAALANDPDSVMDVLFKNADNVSSDEKDMTSAQVNTKRQSSGIVNRIYDEIISGMKKIVTKSGAGDDPSLLRSVQATILLEFTIKGAYGRGNESFLDRDIDNNEKVMASELERLHTRETSYWNRFTAMEKAISNMNSQSSWIGSQMMK